MATSRKTPSTPASKSAREDASKDLRIKPNQESVKAPVTASNVLTPKKTGKRASKAITYPDGMTEADWIEANVNTARTSGAARKTASRVASKTAGKSAPSILRSLDSWAPDEAPNDPRPVNFQLEAELHKQFKAYAALHDETISRLLRALIARELDSEGNE